MDTVTYPDARVQDLAKSFVCIRVEFDHSPEVVKKYGVGPLPDVRLLGPDGKELLKLVGFSSVARLTKQVGAALAVLSGADERIVPRPAPEVKAVEATPEAISAAQAKGVAYLRAHWREARQQGPLSPEPLVLYALVVSGLDATDKDVSEALSSTLGVPIEGTYQAAFRALALTRLDPKGHAADLHACAKFLCDTQLANGQWTYHAAQGAAPAIGDNSNSAFAAMGIAACRKADSETPGLSVARAGSAWSVTQNDDGGWGYRSDREATSYASMTENGIASLILMPRGGRFNGPEDPNIEKATSWLASHFSVRENSASSYQEGRLLYHLYALERAGDLTGETLAGHDWYAEGASYLLGTQRDDGSWDDGADTPVPNTALALLFLGRATKGLR